MYVAGACLGTLLFGQLTDRFGRKKLFMITLGVYLLGTVLTAFSMSPMWYFACRAITGAGIGGEDPLIAMSTVNPEHGWRGAFALGAVLALAVLLVRRNVPESPRWLFIHGREDEGEKIVRDIGQTVHDESGEALPSVSDSITIRQRHTIGLPLIAKIVFTTYPRRSILWFLALHRPGVSGVLLGAAGFFLGSFTAFTLTAARGW